MSSWGFPTDADRDAIARCVYDAARRTSCEIVPVFAESSSQYRAAWASGSLLCAFALSVGANIALTTARTWGGFQASDLWIFPIVFCVSFIVLFLSFQAFPPLRLIFVRSEHSDQEIREAAYTAFFSRATTDQRPAVLLYVSLLERKARIVADFGVNRAVGDAAWAPIASALTIGLRDGRALDAVCDAVRRCASLLERAFPAAETHAPAPAQSEGFTFP